MLRCTFAVIVVATLALAACSGGSEPNKGESDSGAPTETCGSPSPVMKGAVLLPSDLPRPSQVTYTASHKAGPSTIVEAFFADDLDGAYSTYHSAFENTAGYTVTKAEHDPRDAEIDWSSAKSTGEVKMDWPCKGRTDLTITIRPA